MLAYKITDEIPVKIDDATFYLSPLTNEQRTKMLEAQSQESGTVTINTIEMGRIALRYALKRVEGIKFPDGSNFVLKMEDGALSDESLDIIQNLPIYEEQLLPAAIAWGGRTKVDHIDGVEITQKEYIKKKHGRKKQTS